MKRGRDGQAEEYDANPSDPKKLAQQQQLDYMNNMTYAAVAPVAQSAVTSLSDQPASRVVHFRSVTEDITQGDIMSLAVPFGHVDNLLQMRHKNQVLLMFRELQNAIEFINHYISNYTQPTVRNRRMQVSFSRHNAVTAPNTAVGTVLLVDLKPNWDVNDGTLPITADLVWQIFSNYGTVEKIVIINKERLQTLVKFAEQKECANAYDHVHDQTVYVGVDMQKYIKLSIQYSSLADLVISGGPRSVDYTKQMGMAQAPLLATPAGYQNPAPNAPAQAAYAAYAGYGYENYGYPPASAAAQSTATVADPTTFQAPPPPPAAPPAPSQYPPTSNSYPPHPQTQYPPVAPPYPGQYPSPLPGYPPFPPPPFGYPPLPGMMPPPPMPPPVPGQYQYPPPPLPGKYPTGYPPFPPAPMPPTQMGAKPTQPAAAQPSTSSASGSTTHTAGSGLLPLPAGYQPNTTSSAGPSSTTTS